jgi:hypothetical protein
MESIKDKLESNLPQKNFFSHIFDFDKESQNDILNCLQYVLLALIPTIILNKIIQKIIPATTEEKGNVEILAEILGQIVFMFLGFIFIHRLITYFPTWSKIDYKDVNIIGIAIVFLSLMLTIQSKVGTKTNILLDRLFDYWEGNKQSSKPQQQQQQQQQPQQQQQGSLLPPPMVQTNAPSMGVPTQGPQTDFNKMYEGPNTPLENAMVPGGGMPMQESFEPIAANDGLGAFGSF